MPRPGKIEQELTLPQVEELCERLRQSPRRTLAGIQDLAREYGVEIAVGAADTFKRGPFAEYLEKIEKRSRLANAVASVSKPDDVHHLADAAGAEMSQLLFTFMMKLDPESDLTDKETRSIAKEVTQMIEILRRGDHRLIKLQQVVADAKGVLGDESQTAEDRESRLKQIFAMAITLIMAAITLWAPGTAQATERRFNEGVPSIRADDPSLALPPSCNRCKPPLRPACLTLAPIAMSTPKKIDQLRQKIEAALAAADATRLMDDEALATQAEQWTAGNNINGWINPYPADHPFSLFKEYQFRYAHDEGRFKAGLWGRQTGKDFTTEGEAVADCFKNKGVTWMVAAPSERQSLDSLDKAKDWARAFDLAIADYKEAREGSHSETLLKSAEVIFANGSRIVAVPGKPDTVRGKSASILLTEFDFFEDPAATWRAILPSITNPLRGGEKKVRLVTTPNGNGSAMHKIWTREDGKMKWSRHLVTVYHAVLHGMPIDIVALREAFGDDLEGFAQECLCRFLDGSNVLLPYELIATCESMEASMHDTPAMLKASPLRKVAGIDFGRVNDPTVMALGLNGLGINIVRNITKLKGMSTPDQVATLKPYLDLCDRICVDYTGPGIGFGDELVKLYGEWKPEDHKLNGKVELCTFTLPLKRELFPTLRVAFEKRNLRVPVDTWLREDLHAMAQVITNGQYNYKAPRSDEGHSDGCTALALMQRAGQGASGGGFERLAAPNSSGSDDSGIESRGRFAGMVRGLFGRRGARNTGGMFA